MGQVFDLRAAREQRGPRSASQCSQCRAPSFGRALCGECVAWHARLEALAQRVADRRHRGKRGRS
jgi:hypothetical protein